MGDTMITLFENKSNCCGCGACVQICPQKAITMEMDEYGYKYPIINHDLCIECNLCKRVCHYQNYSENNHPIKTYAAASKDDTLIKKSTSGGLFATIATCVLNENGVVFGASMDFKNEKLWTHHIKITDISELPKLQGSKYMQSDIDNCYSEAKKELNSGKFVFFSGTPCQIAGLNGYLGKEYPNLITADVICHGVGSVKMFQDYIEILEKKHNAKVTSFTFRDKTVGWGLDGKYTYTKNGKSFGKHLYYKLSSFYSLYIKAAFYRENCYKCKYACPHRPADFTLGDFWGVEKSQPEVLTINGGSINEEIGISCMIVNTKKGIDILEKYKNSFILEPSTFEKVSAHNACLVKPTELNDTRQKVLQLYKEKGFIGVDDYYWKTVGKKKLYFKILSVAPRGLKKSLKKLLGKKWDKMREKM